MNLLSLVEFSEEAFTFDDGDVLIGDASIMEDRHLQKIEGKQSEYGFAVLLGDKRLVFRMTDVKRSPDGEEIYGWHYSLTEKSKTNYPEMSHVSAIVYND